MEELVAHVSTRVFLGKRLSRNDEWVGIVKTYANRMIAAVIKMRTQNGLLLPITHWFIPECKAVRAQYGRAKKVIENEVKQREIAYQKTIAAGEKPAKLYDSVSWALEMAKGEHVDTTNFQLALALAGIVTTSELTAQCMVALAEHPEFVEPIREEIISVIGSGGWQKTTLYKLRLLDSFVKEVQRLRPGQQVQMRRRTGSKPLTLSTGVVIPPRASVGVSMENMTDPAVYTDPERFDAYRFVRMREATGNDSGHQLASLSPDHLGFGYGDHACPGRFFAASEVKIVLCHMLLKYDWRLADGVAERVPDVRIESRFQVHADQRLEYRRRQEEIEL